MAPILALVSATIASLSAAIDLTAGATTITHTLSLSAVNNSLPSPPSSTPLYIGIGLGTQNYTCSAPDAAPTAAGAYARLYSAANVANLTGIANDYVEAYQTALQTPLICKAGDLSCPDSVNFAKHGFAKLGEHYFTASTPTFNLDGSAASKPSGVLFAKVIDSAFAPSGAYPGANEEGAVEWLYLDNHSTAESTSDASYVYRIETAGGTAPTCTKEGTVQIPYSAQYWFY